MLLVGIKLELDCRSLPGALPGGHIRFPQSIRETFQSLGVLTTRAT